MKVIRYHDPNRFIADNLSLLQQEEATNNLIIGLAYQFESGKFSVEEGLLFAVQEAGQSIFCALQTPGRNLTFYGTVEAIPTAVNWLRIFCEEREHVIPGLVAPQQLCQAFAEAWQRQTGISWKLEMDQRVFQLDQVAPFQKASGHLRKASEADLETLVQWLVSFHDEAVGEDIRGQELERAKAMLAANRLYVWEDSQIVSMAASTRATANGVSINAVFTPKAFRGNGFASNCVAGLCQLLLDQGYQFCSLFTDASNPTSNKIYRAIGFREVAKFQSIDFLSRE